MQIHIDDSQLIQIVLKQGKNKIYLNYNNGILVSTDTVPITEDVKKMSDREMIDKAAEFWGNIPSRPEDIDLTKMEDNNQNPSDWSSIELVKEMQEELKDNVHIPTTEQTLNHYSTLVGHECGRRFANQFQKERNDEIEKVEPTPTAPLFDNHKNMPNSPYCEKLDGVKNRKQLAEKMASNCKTSMDNIEKIKGMIDSLTEPLCKEILSKFDLANTDTGEYLKKEAQEESIDEYAKEHPLTVSPANIGDNSSIIASTTSNND